jgi:autotransporter-associated beta strand protein
MTRSSRLTAVLILTAIQSVPAFAVTRTWTGAVADPGDPTRALWDDTTANWTPGNYVNGDPINVIPGDDVIFTDAVAGLKNVHFTPTGTWPNSITFAHVAGGAPQTYTFTATPVASTGNGLNGSTSLLMDVGFAGRVKYNARSASTATNNPISLTVRDGIFELGDHWALPGGTTVVGGSTLNTPNVVMEGGAFEVNVHPGLTPLTNPNLTSTNLSGKMTVVNDARLTLNCEDLALTASSAARLWNGSIEVAAGKTLLITSAHTNTGAGLPAGHAINMAANLSTSAGTISLGNLDTRLRLDRSGTNLNVGGTNLTLDLGTGAGRVNNNLPNTAGNLLQIGALTGGPMTRLDGSNTGSPTTTFTDTFVIGAKNINATFAGVIADGTGTTLPHLTAIQKVGTATQTLNGPNLYTGSTTVSAGTLVLGLQAHAPVLAGPGGAVIDGGRLVLDYTGGTSPAAAVQTELAASYASSPTFSVGRLRSTTAIGNRGLGWVNDISTSTVTIALALYGDADLSGTVDFSDLLKLAQNYNLTTGMTWSDGDFDYDSGIGFTDLLSLAQNYSLSLSQAQLTQIDDAQFAADWTLALSMVPEPTAALVAMPSLLMLRRRRTR